MNKLFATFVGIALLVLASCQQTAPTPQITNFDECVAAGNPVMESFPEQCRANGQTFVNEAPPKGIAIGEPNPSAPITNFEQCVAAGNPVMRSYPAQCAANGQTFVEDLNQTPSEKMRVMPSNEPLPPGVQAGKTYVESKTNQSAIVLRAEEINWTDSCLGLGGPAESCLAAITPGYNLTIYAGESEYEIHTTTDGSEVREANVKHTGALMI